MSAAPVSPSSPGTPSSLGGTPMRSPQAYRAEQEQAEAATEGAKR